MSTIIFWIWILSIAATIVFAKTNGRQVMTWAALSIVFGPFALGALVVLLKHEQG